MQQAYVAAVVTALHEMRDRSQCCGIDPFRTLHIPTVHNEVLYGGQLQHMEIQCRSYTAAHEPVRAASTQHARPTNYTARMGLPSWPGSELNVDSPGSLGFLCGLEHTPHRVLSRTTKLILSTTAARACLFRCVHNCSHARYTYSLKYSRECGCTPTHHVSFC
jgi:hypothetical protein